MNVGVVITAWGGGQQVFDMLAPFWEMHGLPILVACPKNSRVSTKHRVFCYGMADHTGPAAIARWVNLLNFLWTEPHDIWVIFEYDSLCLDPQLYVRPGFYGIDRPNFEGARFMASHYLGPPWTIDRESLRRLRQVANVHHEVYEHGCDDRYLAALAMIAGVPMLNHDRAVYIPGAVITSGHYDMVRKAIRGGGTYVHGVKTQECLNAVVAMRKEYESKRYVKGNGRGAAGHCPP